MGEPVFVIIGSLHRTGHRLIRITIALSDKAKVNWL